MTMFPSRDTHEDARRRAYPIYLALSRLSRLFFALIATVNLIYQFEVALLAHCSLCSSARCSNQSPF
jgi:hypothetical protein